MHGVRATLQNSGVLCESRSAHQQLHKVAAHQGAARPLRHPFVLGGNETSSCKAKLESDNQGEILCTHKKNMWSSLKERRKRRLIGRKRGTGEEGEEGEGGEGGEGG